MEHVETTWRQMNTHGQTWKLTDTQGHAWSCGHKKIYPDTQRYTNIHAETHGHKQKHMDIHRQRHGHTRMAKQGLQQRDTVNGQTVM